MMPERRHLPNGELIQVSLRRQFTFFMKHRLLTLFSALLLAACSPVKKIAFKNDPLGGILKELAADSIGGEVLRNPGVYEIQIIYTQIDRDGAGQPTFTSYWHNVDSTRYFYPASVVKMPLALLSLEKINELKRNGYPRLTRNTPYRLDSLRAFQQNYAIDAGAPDRRPSIAHDVRQIFMVSDNLAYNHMFEFLGREYINATLHRKGYTRTGIVHRFNYAGRDNRYTSPIAFYDQNGVVLKEGERYDSTRWENPQHNTLKGKGYISKGALVNQPFDMKTKNWFALTDMEKMLKAIIFPEAVPSHNRFNLSDDDHRFLWRYMGLFPRECDFPQYDPKEYYDGYVKFFLFGDGKEPRDGSVRVFNKVGEAYGTLTDVAYIVDFKNNTEFMLSATILCNKDGVFNDDQYDYDKIGFPFLAKLGRAVHTYDLKRPRATQPELSKYGNALKTH
jgi:Beta-lactamase enzyme family